jgi:hypothetical protein
MSDIRIDSPDSWIGIPEEWPNARWQTPYQWASELTEAKRTEWGVAAEQADATFRDILVSVANSLDPTEASRLYISVDGWAGPLFIVAMALVPPERVEGLTAAQVAGSDDSDTIETPIVQDFTSIDGVAGNYCVRYFTRENPDRIVARVDFVLPFGDMFVDFYHENSDLIAFRRALPRLRELASTAVQTA